MKAIECIKCGSIINVPDLNMQEKEDLMKVKKQESFIELINRIHRMTQLSLKDSKAIYFHMNNRGSCHRCNYKDLVGENVICPRCKSLNLNW